MSHGSSYIYQRVGSSKVTITFHRCYFLVVFVYSVEVSLGEKSVVNSEACNGWGSEWDRWQLEGEVKLNRMSLLFKTNGEVVTCKYSLKHNQNACGA